MAEDKQTDTGITESIDELENLIAETRLPPRLQGEIPVLNDVVDAAEARRYAQTDITSASNSPTDKTESFPIDRLNELLDSVDQKISNELDDLVDTFKHTIKGSIIDELKEQLKKESSQMQVPHPGGDTSDKPSE